MWWIVYNRKNSYTDLLILLYYWDSILKSDCSNNLINKSLIINPIYIPNQCRVYICGKKILKNKKKTFI